MPLNSGWSPSQSPWRHTIGATKMGLFAIYEVLPLDAAHERRRRAMAWPSWLLLSGKIAKGLFFKNKEGTLSLMRFAVVSLHLARTTHTHTHTHINSLHRDQPSSRNGAPPSHSCHHHRGRCEAAVSLQRAPPENILTLHNVDFEKMLVHDEYDAWFRSHLAVAKRLFRLYAPFFDHSKRLDLPTTKLLLRLVDLLRRLGAIKASSHIVVRSSNNMPRLRHSTMPWQHPPPACGGGLARSRRAFFI
ncbi:hypothetical protein GQ600_5218 [Phytophthora cactorum]|nr:hypothetical protein GQ600_5218 [Phytophthora cactorum]